MSDEAKKAKAAAEKAGVEVVRVVSEAGATVREYSAEVHGENFVKLAEEFAKKFSHTVQRVR